jgi:integrase
MALEHMGYATMSPGTRVSVERAMRKALNALVMSGAHYLLPDTVPHTKVPSPRSVVVPTDTLSLLLAHAVPWLRLLILLCHDTALRSTSAGSIARHHYDEATNEIRVVGKGQQVTIVPASQRIRAMLLDAPLGTAPYVELYRGKPMHHSSVQQAFRRLCVSLDLGANVRLHDLRRTMAEKTYNVTSDLRVVQQLLGHSALHSTTQYLQRPGTPATRANLAAAMELSLVEN